MNKRYMDFVPVKKGEATPAPAVVLPEKSSVKAVPSQEVRNTVPNQEVQKAKSRVAFGRRIRKTAPKDISNQGVQKTVPKVAPRSQAPKPALNRQVRESVSEVEIDEIDFQKLFEERDAARARAGGANSEFGVIEDYHAKFVKTEVEKRPLNASENTLKEAKAKKIIKKPIVPARKTAKSETVKNAAQPVEKPVEKSKNEEKQTLKIPKVQFMNLEKVEKRPLSKNVYTKKAIPTKEVKSGPVTIISKPEKNSRAGLIVTIIITIILGAAAGTVAFLLLPK